MTRSGLSFIILFGNDIILGGTQQCCLSALGEELNIDIRRIRIYVGGNAVTSVIDENLGGDDVEENIELDRLGIIDIAGAGILVSLGACQLDASLGPVYDHDLLLRVVISDRLMFRALEISDTYLLGIINLEFSHDLDDIAFNSFYRD